MAQTDGLKLPIPELTEAADGPDAFADLANGLEDWAYDRILPAGVLRAPAHSWGAVTTLPSGAAVKAGDTAYYTPYKVLVAYNGTAWRQAEVPLVTAGDVSAAAGFYIGQLREHSVAGLQRWNGSVWGPPEVLPRCTVVNPGGYNVVALTNNNVPWTGATSRSTPGMWSSGNAARVYIPETGSYDVTTWCPWTTLSAQGIRQHGVRRNGDNAQLSWLASTNQHALPAPWGSSDQSGNFPDWDLVAGDYIEMIVFTNAASFPIAPYVRMTVELKRR